MRRSKNNVLFKVFFSLALILFPSAMVYAGTVDLPQTGQKTSYIEGDAGSIQSGVEWPNPRFVDNGDGTINDKLTGLMWLKDGHCFGNKAWQDALDIIAEFNSSPNNFECSGYTANIKDWHLPNILELQSLINYEEENQADWLNRNSFVDLQSEWYWSSTTTPNLASSALGSAKDVFMESGVVGGGNPKTIAKGVLPVRFP